MGAAMAVSAAVADRVTLLSGSCLTGEAGAIQDGKLLFKSDDLGELKIDLAKIKTMDVAKSHVLQYADDSTEEKVLTIRDGALWSGVDRLDMAKVKAVDPVAETWHGSVNLAFNAARGNTYDNSAAVVANANRRWERDRLNLDFGYFYGENGKVGNQREKHTDRWDVEAKHDHFWLPAVYNYENVKWERDVIQELDARYRVGLGGGYQWLEKRGFESTGKWSFNQEFGVNWVKEEYANGGDAEAGGFAALRYGHHFAYVPKWFDSVECFHNLEVLPDAGDWEKFLANADVGFSTKIVYDFNLLAKVEWDYNSQPANDRKKSDARYVVGLGYKW